MGPGDRVDLLQHEIISATCRQDGRLLLPDLPAKAAPIQLLQMAFANKHNPLEPHAFQVVKNLKLLISQKLQSFLKYRQHHKSQFEPSELCRLEKYG